MYASHCLLSCLSIWLWCECVCLCLPVPSCKRISCRKWTKLRSNISYMLWLWLWLWLCNCCFCMLYLHLCMYVEMFTCCWWILLRYFPIHIWLMMMVVTIVYGVSTDAVVVVVMLCCLLVSTLILKDIANPWVWTYIGHWAKNFQYKQ